MPDPNRSHATGAVFHPVTECPWCRSRELAHLATRGDGLEVKRCAACGLAFLAELPDDLGVFYDPGYFRRSPVPGTAPAESGYEDYERSFSPSSFRWLSMLIRCAAGPSRNRLFDFGAATGTFLEIARYEGFSVAGSELTQEGAAAARAKGLDVRPGPFAPEDWDPGSFDVVTALEVLEHVRDIRATLQDLSRLLQPNGLLVFLVPNLTSAIVDRYGDEAHDLNKSYEHTLYFDPRSMRGIVSEIFGPDAFSLYTPEVDEEGQVVSYGLGIVRRQATTDRPEADIFLALEDESRTVAISDVPAAYAVALGAAKFFRNETADAAIDRARELGASDPELALVEAQVLRNRGELFNAIAAVERALTAEEVDALASQLLAEILEDYYAMRGIPEHGIADGMRQIDARLASAADEIAALASRAETAQQEAAESRRDLAAALRLAESREQALQEADRRVRAAADRANALGRDSERLRAELNAIYTSKGWKALTGVWRMEKGLTFWRRGAAEGDGSVGEAAHGPEAPAVYPVAVSVIMPVFNKGRVLITAVESVLASTMPSFEIVIWDDGSDDQETARAIDEVRSHPQVRIFRGPNQGVIGARNSAMGVARGEHFMCLDPDDTIAPTYLEKAVAVLASQPGVSIVYPWQRSSGGRQEVWETRDLDPHLIAKANHVPVCAVFRRELFAQTGGFSPQMREGFEDWELWAHAAELGFQGRAIPEPLFEYHYSEDAAESRDATARRRHLELASRISSLHPTLGRLEAPVPRTPPPVLDLPPAVLPAGEGRPIVLTLPWFTIGGADKVVEDLITHWTGQGRTVVALTTVGVGPGMVDRFGDLLGLTPFAYHLPSLAPEDLWLDFVSHLLEGLPEATILNIGSGWMQRNASSVKASRPGTIVVDQQFNPVGHLLGNIEAGPGLDLTVTAYERLREQIIEMGRSEGEVRTIYVGIDPVAGSPPEAVASFRKTTGLTESQRFVAFVGRLSEEKRPEWLIPLADALAAHDVAVVVVGSGPLERELSPELRRRGNVFWLGSLDDLGPVYQAASAVVIPSRTEGIPLTAMEALSAGVPIVATAVGGLPELAPAPGVTLTSRDDRDAFIAAVIATVTDPEPARPSLPEHLRSDHMGRRYDEAIDQRSRNAAR